MCCLKKRKRRKKQNANKQTNKHQTRAGGKPESDTEGPLGQPSLGKATPCPDPGLAGAAGTGTALPLLYSPFSSAVVFFLKFSPHFSFFPLFLFPPFFLFSLIFSPPFFRFLFSCFFFLFLFSFAFLSFFFFSSFVFFLHFFLFSSFCAGSG